MKMRILASLILLSTYVVGTLSGAPAESAFSRQHIKITHSHSVPDSKHEHQHEHDDDFGHEDSPQTSEEEHRSTPHTHTHCISLPTAVAYCLRIQTVHVSPVPASPVAPVPSENRIPDDPSLASIFRPPIA